MIGERLRNLRKQRDVKQDELASFVGVQKTAISLYETGKNDPSDMIKVKIAEYFNISLDYLLGVVNEEIPYYDSNKFFYIPDDLSSDEKALLNDFVQFILYRRNKQG